MLFKNIEKIHILNIPSMLAHLSSAYDAHEHSTYQKVILAINAKIANPAVSKLDRDILQHFLCPFVLQYQERLAAQTKRQFFDLPLMGSLFESAWQPFYVSLEKENKKITHLMSLLNQLNFPHSQNPKYRAQDKSSWLDKTQHTLSSVKKNVIQFSYQHWRGILGIAGLGMGLFWVAQSYMTGGIAYLQLWQQLKNHFIEQFGEVSSQKWMGYLSFLIALSNTSIVTSILNLITYLAIGFVAISAAVLLLVGIQKIWHMIRFKYIQEGIEQAWGIECRLKLVSDFQNQILNISKIDSYIIQLDSQENMFSFLEAALMAQSELFQIQKKLKAHQKWNKWFPIDVQKTYLAAFVRIQNAHENFANAKSTFSVEFIRALSLWVQRAMFSPAGLKAEKLPYYLTFISRLNPEHQILFQQTFNPIHQITEKLKINAYLNATCTAHSNPSHQVDGLRHNIMTEHPNQEIKLDAIIQDIEIARHLGFDLINAKPFDTQYQQTLVRLKQMLMHQFPKGYPEKIEIEILAQNLHQYNQAFPETDYRYLLQSYLFKSADLKDARWYPCFLDTDLDILRGLFYQYQAKLELFRLTVDKIVDVEPGCELDLSQPSTWHIGLEQHSLIGPNHLKAYQALIDVLENIATGLQLENPVQQALSQSIKAYFLHVYNGSNLAYIALESFLSQDERLQIAQHNALKRLLHLATLASALISKTDEAYFLNMNLSCPGWMEEGIIQHPFWEQPWQKSVELFLTRCVDNGILSKVILQDYRLKRLNEMMTSPHAEHSLALFAHFDHQKPTLAAITDYFGHQNIDQFYLILKKLGEQYLLFQPPLVPRHQQDAVLMQFQLKQTLEDCQQVLVYERSWLVLFELALKHSNMAERLLLYVNKLFSLYDRLDLDKVAHKKCFHTLLSDLFFKLTQTALVALISKSHRVFNFCLMSSKLNQKIPESALIEMAKAPQAHFAFLMLFNQVNLDKPLPDSFVDLWENTPAYQMYLIRQHIQPDWVIPINNLVAFLNQDARLLNDLIAILSKFSDKFRLQALLFKHLPCSRTTILQLWLNQSPKFTDAESAQCFASIKCLLKLNDIRKEKAIKAGLESLMTDLTPNVRRALESDDTVIHKVQNIGVIVVQFCSVFDLGRYPPEPDLDMNNTLLGRIVPAIKA